MEPYSLFNQNISLGEKPKRRGIQKPVRNKSAFILFSQNMRKKMLEANEEERLNPNDQMAKCAELWKDVDSQTKEYYNKLAQEDKIRYLKEMKEFYINFPLEKLENKTKKNHVKKASTAYGIFLRKEKLRIKEENPKLRMVEIMKIIAEKWSKLEKREKEIYDDEAEKEKKMKNNEFCEAALKKNVRKSSYKVQMNRRAKKIQKINQALKELGEIVEENNYQYDDLNLSDIQFVREKLNEVSPPPLQKEKGKGKSRGDQKENDFEDLLGIAKKVKKNPQNPSKTSKKLISDLISFKLLQEDE